MISNVFTYKLVNKTTQRIEDIRFKLRGFDGVIKLVSIKDSFSIEPQDLAEGTMFIELKQSDLTGDKNKIRIDVYSQEELIESTSVNFLGPRSFN